MRRRRLLAAPALLGALPLAATAADQPLVVVELFTSEGCSSCPPADAVLRELSEFRPDVLALSYHVTYWDQGGWRDPFSLAEATDHQRRYRRALGLDQLYTPQAVVQGRRDVVGFDRPALERAIREAAGPARVPLALAEALGGLDVTLGAAPGQAGVVWLVGFDRRHVTPVRGGENGGRTLVHANVVRSLTRAADWRGEALRLRPARPAGERMAVLLQGRDGAILGAAAV